MDQSRNVMPICGIVACLGELYWTCGNTRTGHLWPCASHIILSTMHSHWSSLVLRLVPLLQHRKHMTAASTI
jgi:hypothetical protein